MFNQIYQNLNDLDLISFRNEGFIQSFFDSDVIWLGHGDNAQGEISFSNCNFFKNECNKFTPKYVVKTNKTELLNFLQDFKCKYPLQILDNRDSFYVEDVSKIKSWIKNGHIAKMVAVTSESYSIKKYFDVLSVIFNLLENLSGSIYGYWRNDQGVLGITPEPLFVCNDVTGYTFALAGTISKEIPNYKEILLNDPKELSEHNLVIDDLERKLINMATEVKILKTEVIDFGNIAHLKTTLNFKLKESENHFELIKKLSPSAALGGYPAQVVNDYYSKTVHYNMHKDKRIFGATMGLMTKDYSQALVMIRNVQWDKNKLWIESGSGIVCDSIIEKELSEVKRKRDTIKKAIFLC